jgi:hypothetical protein
MVGNGDYVAVARAIDYAGQTSVVYSTRSFTVDVTSPTVAISTPVATTYSPVQVSTPMTGTSADSHPSATGVSTVAVSITDLDGGGGNYFNGTAFAAGGPFYLGINGGTPANWTFTPGPLPLVNDHRYQVDARATDVAGNVTAATSVTFFYDAEIPTATVTSLSGAYVRSLSSVSGTATDERFGARSFESKLGTGTVGIAIFEGASLRWWDGSSSFNSATPVFIPTVNSTTVAPNTWTFSFPPALQSALVDGSSYRFAPRAVDMAGNAEYAASTVPAGVGVTVIYDPNVPTVAVVNPNDLTPADDTSPRISTVTLWAGQAAIVGTASDGSGSGVQTVEVRVWKSDPTRYSNPVDGTFSLDPATQGELAWFPATSSNSWVNWYSTFTFPTDYRFHVEARARDQAGAYSTAYATATFLFDQDVPRSGNHGAGHGHHAIGLGGDHRNHGGDQHALFWNRVARPRGLARIGPAERRQMVGHLQQQFLAQ